MKVCSSADIPEGGRIVVDLGSRTIGIFRLEGKLHAYENVCPHQGGPVCQGTILPRVVEQLEPDSKAATGFRFDRGDMHIVCPWHGFEYSIDTGKHAGTPKFKLTRVQVTELNGEVHADG